MLNIELLTGLGQLTRVPVTWLRNGKAMRDVSRSVDEGSAWMVSLIEEQAVFQLKPLERDVFVVILKEDDNTVILGPIAVLTGILVDDIYDGGGQNERSRFCTLTTAQFIALLDLLASILSPMITVDQLNKAIAVIASLAYDCPPPVKTSADPGREENLATYLLINAIRSGDTQQTDKAVADLVSCWKKEEAGQQPLRYLRARMLGVLGIVVYSLSGSVIPPELLNRRKEVAIGQIEGSDELDHLISIFEEGMVGLTGLVERYSIGRFSPIVNRVVRYLHEHITTGLKVPDIARLVNLSPNYLGSIFRQETGQSIPIYYNQLRINEAKKLLISTDWSVQSISNYLGFGTQAYFSRVFTDYVGYTPRKYRLSRLGGRNWSTADAGTSQ